METITIYYAGTTYRVVYEPDTCEIVEVLQYLDATHAKLVDFDELDEQLQNKIEKAVA